MELNLPRKSNMNLIPRYERREKEKIDNFMNSLLKKFIAYKQKESDLHGEGVDLLFASLNNQWRKFCNKKFKFHKCDIHAFERQIETQVKEIKSYI